MTSQTASIIANYAGSVGYLSSNPLGFCRLSRSCFKVVGWTHKTWTWSHTRWMVSATWPSWTHLPYNWTLPTHHVHARMDVYDCIQCVMPANRYIGNVKQGVGCVVSELYCLIIDLLSKRALRVCPLVLSCLVRGQRHRTILHFEVYSWNPMACTYTNGAVHIIPCCVGLAQHGSPLSRDNGTYYNYTVLATIIVAIHTRL